IIIIFILFAISMVVLSKYGEKVSSGVRGSIYGEGQWTKAQKKAAFSLLNLINTGEKAYYEEFENALLVNEGDKIARITLLSENPDIDLARRGLLQGNNHPEDIDSMIWVLRNFKDFDHIRKAIGIWTEGDLKIDQLRDLASDVYSSIETGELSETSKEEFRNRLIDLDRELTILETEFSNAMSDAARWAEHRVFWLTITISLVLIFSIAFLSITFLQAVKDSNNRLKKSEKKFRNVLENSRDMIYQLNLKTGRYDYVSSSVQELLGYSAEEVAGEKLEFLLNQVHHEDIKSVTEKIDRVKSADQPDVALEDTEFRIKRSDGKYIWVNNIRAAVRNEKGEIEAIVGNVRDITVQKKYLEQIRKSLREKSVLLSEIHHRVKNNLGIISSIIEIQKAEMDSTVSEKFDELQGRIKSIGLVHEKLYKTETFSEVDLSIYLRELTDIISEGFKMKGREISLNYDMEKVKVDNIRAVPIGLICNELINNAFKHAFSGKEGGKLSLSLKQKSGEVELSVSDNAGKLPDNFSLDQHESLGMTLIRVLTMQLEGEVSYEQKKGVETTFNVRFARERNQESGQTDS
ncbi:MAG: PAS domain S-box protein, partial [Balneolaceae bacterium]